MCIPGRAGDTQTTEMATADMAVNLEKGTDRATRVAEGPGVEVGNHGIDTRKVKLQNDDRSTQDTTETVTPTTNVKTTTTTTTDRAENTGRAIHTRGDDHIPSPPPALSPIAPIESADIETAHDHDPLHANPTSQHDDHHTNHAAAPQPLHPTPTPSKPSSAPSRQILNPPSAPAAAAPTKPTQRAWTRASPRRTIPPQTSDKPPMRKTTGAKL
jgi:hypothetical protein